MTPFSVKRALDEYIDLIEESRDPDGKYHPSSFWNCMRQTIYGVRGVEKTNPPSAESKRRFKIGHMIHELVQAALSYSVDLVAFYAEFEVEIPDLNITGHGDGLAILRTPDGDVIVVEVKSAKASSFRYGLKDGHVLQVSTYSVAVHDYKIRVTDLETGEVTEIGPFGDRLIGVQVVYIEKESADMKEFFIPYDSDDELRVVPGLWKRRLEERVAEADEYRNDPESLPARLPLVKGKLPWQCNPKWCEWYDRCMGEAKEGVEPLGEKVEHWG